MAESSTAAALNVATSSTSKLDKLITLVTKENTRKQYPLRYCIKCNLLKQNLGIIEDEDDDSSDDDDDLFKSGGGANDEVEIPLVTISAPCIEQVMSFARLNAQYPLDPIPKPCPSEEFTKFVRPKVLADWVVGLSTHPDTDICWKLIKAAEYLDYPDLNTIMCAYIANQMELKPIEELQKNWCQQP